MSDDFDRNLLKEVMKVMSRPTDYINIKIAVTPHAYERMMLRNDERGLRVLQVNVRQLFQTGMVDLQAHAKQHPKLHWRDAVFGKVIKVELR